MVESILIAAEQTAILFVLMGLGFVARRLGMLDAETIRKLSAIVVNYTTPAIIITAFQCPFDAAKLPGLGWAFLASAIAFAIAIAIERIFFLRGRDARGKALRWSVIFSNAGYMGLPLEYALFGADGIFYGVVPIAMWNLVGWTYGVSIFRPLEGGRDLVKGVFNPANVASVIALALFFLPWRLPNILASPIKMVGEMNTPLPMFVMGYFLGGANFGSVFCNIRVYGMLFSRHFAAPLLLVAALCLMPFIPLEQRLISVVPYAAPIGVLLTVFAVRYGGDAEYSTALVAVSTVFSIFTIPLVVGLAKLLLSL